MDISIRKAEKEDIMRIHDMAEIVFRHTYRDILSAEQVDYMMDWMYSPAGLEQQMDDGHVYYIAFRDAGPCGYVSIQSDGADSDGRMVFHLQKIYVLPAEQGHGTGKRLFDCAVGHVHAEAGDRPARIELNVNRNNPAIGFYNRLGFRILRQGDFDIGHGFYMNDYIMGMDI